MLLLQHSSHRCCLMVGAFVLSTVFLSCLPRAVSGDLLGFQGDLLELADVSFMTVTASQNLPTSSASALSSKIETLSTTNDANFSNDASPQLFLHSLDLHRSCPAFNDASSTYMEQQQYRSEHQMVTHADTGSQSGNMAQYSIHPGSFSTAPGIYGFAGHIAPDLGGNQANSADLAPKPKVAMQQAYAMKKVQEQKDLMQQQQQLQQREGFFKSLLQISQQQQQQHEHQPLLPPPLLQQHQHGILKKSPSPSDHATSLSANIEFAPASNSQPELPLCSLLMPASRSESNDDQSDRAQHHGTQLSVANLMSAVGKGTGNIWSKPGAENGPEEAVVRDNTTPNLGPQERPRAGSAASSAPPASSYSAPPASSYSSSHSLYGSQPRRVAFNGNGFNVGSGPILGNTEDAASSPTSSGKGLVLSPNSLPPQTLFPPLLPSLTSRCLWFRHITLASSAPASPPPHTREKVPKSRAKRNWKEVTQSGAERDPRPQRHVRGENQVLLSEERACA
jgi:hypothetical protein